jgi:hypothetical protein
VSSLSMCNFQFSHINLFTFGFRLAFCALL